MASNEIIIFSTAYFPLVGGAEIAIKEITDRLPDFKFKMITAKIKSGLADKEKIGNVEVFRCGFGSSWDKYLLPILGPFVAFRVAKRQDVHAIWSMMASFGGFAALFYCWRRPETRFLLTLQEGDPPEYILRRVRPFGFLFKNIFTRANSVQTISNFLAGWAKDMGFKGEPVVIPNGVDVKRFAARIDAENRRELREKFGFESDDVVLATASRLVLKNGTHDLISSLALLPDNFKAMIIGEGEDRAKLDKIVAENKLENRVVFLGLRGHDELPSLLQSADVFVRPSLSEGLGNSFLEAMAAGLPIVGTPVGGIPDFLKDGETGVFCQPSNPESVAQAVLRIQNQPEFRRNLIENGFKLSTKNYNWDSIAAGMRDLFNKM